MRRLAARAGVMNPELLEATARTAGVRLDVFVADLVADTDRIGAGALIRAGLVEVVDRPLIKPSTWLVVGDRVRVRLPTPTAAPAEPENLALPILYRDDDMVIVRKPSGMATHPGPGWWHGSAVNALLHHVAPWRPIGGVATPGIVHRLDRDTAGLLVFANGTAAHQALLVAMRERRIERRYMAWVAGRLEGAGVIDRPLARDPADPQRVIIAPEGKPAVTHWRSLATHAEATLLELRLETGRNHQIRVHLAALGHPVLGDPWYGGPAQTQNGALKLFAYRLALAHPRTGNRLVFLARPPWAGSPVALSED